MIHFTLKYPHVDLGVIPMMLDLNNPEPAAKQFDAQYQHGGGWRKFTGFKVMPDGRLKYPGDPALHVLAEAQFRDEFIRFYESSWVSITQKDGSVEICRMD